MRTTALLLLVVMVIGLAGCGLLPNREDIQKENAPRLGVWANFVNKLYTTFVNMVCFTFPQIVDNPNVRKLQNDFTSLATLVIIVGFMGSGIATMLGLQSTRLGDMIARTIVALVFCKLVIPFIIWAIHVDNSLVRAITALGGVQLNGTSGVDRVFMIAFEDGFIQFFANVAFIAAFVYYIVKILFTYATRLFDMIVLAVLSPFAAISLVFDSTKGLFSKWFKELLSVLMIQVVHALYLTVFTMIMVAPGPIEQASDGIMRVLLVIGGLWRMSQTPRWLRGLINQPERVHVSRSVTESVGFNAAKKLYNRFKP